MRVLIKIVVLVTVMLASVAQSYAAGNCSAYLQSANINEVFKDLTTQANDPDDFIEVKLLDPTVPEAIYSTWTIEACEQKEGNGKFNSGDGCSGQISLADIYTATSNLPWLVIKDGTIGKYINFKTGFDIILLDADDDVIDYLSTEGYRFNEKPGCTGTDLVYDFEFIGAGRGSDKFIFRRGDGIGSWQQELSAAALPTEGASNDGVAAPAVDHFNIAHDGNAINCQAENITISAHTSTHAIDTTYVGTISLTTSTAHGDWSYVSGGSAARFTNSGSGVASYDFDGSENGSIVLALENTFEETISINVTDGAQSERSGAWIASDDPSLAYASSGFRFLADAAVDNISTQIAGKQSDVGYGAQVLELEAIDTNASTGACEAALSGAVTVQIGYSCENPAVCQRPLYMGSVSPITPVNGTNGTAASINYDDITLDFGDDTDTTATFVMNYPDAGQIQLHAQRTLAPGGELMEGSSNSIVSRPFGFTVVANGNPAAVDANGSAYTTAGSAFTVTSAAVLWNSADDDLLGASDGMADNHIDSDPANNDSLVGNIVTLGGINYTGAPNFGQEGESLQLSSLLFLPSGGVDPGITGSTSISTFAAGAGSSTDVRFYEVGIIEIAAAVSDGDYLGIGAIETLKMVSKSGHVGRFRPAKFAISNSLNGSFANSCTMGATDFTYIGQPFGYDIAPGFRVTAQNELNNTTLNYRGSFVKLNANSITITPTSVDSDTTQPGTDGNPLSVTYTSAPMTLTPDNLGNVDFVFGADSFVYGTALASDEHGRDANSEVTEFTADINPEISEITDGETTTPGLSETFDIAGNLQRFGRLRMMNVHGSELTDLRMPMIVEYLSTAGYVINTDDDGVGCTGVATVHLGLSDSLTVPGSSTVTVVNSIADEGNLGVLLTSPGEDIVGEIVVTPDLGDSGAAHKWLRYNWTAGAEFDMDPSATATFGIYKGNPATIYIQQMYQ